MNGQSFGLMCAFRQFFAAFACEPSHRGMQVFERTSNVEMVVLKVVCTSFFHDLSAWNRLTSDRLLLSTMLNEPFHML
jgi:hypothetical protein